MFISHLLWNHNNFCTGCLSTEYHRDWVEILRSYNPSVNIGVKGFFLFVKAKSSKPDDIPSLPITNSTQISVFLSCAAWISRKALSRVLPHTIQVSYSHKGNLRNCFHVCCLIRSPEIPSDLLNFRSPRRAKTLRNTYKGQESENATCKWTVLLGRQISSLSEQSLY